MKRETIRVPVLALALVGAGCAAHQSAGGCPVHSDPKAVAPVSAAPGPQGAGVPQGTVVQCPVTGENVTVGPDTLHSAYRGKDYYFCCTPCKASFDQDPEKFLQGK